MSKADQLNQYAQQVTLTMTRHFMASDDLVSPDGQLFVQELIASTNLFIGDFETEADWNYARQYEMNLGTVGALTQTYLLDDSVRKIVVDKNRPLHIYQGGIPVSTWDVVSPDMITAPRDPYPLRDRVMQLGRNLIFSRVLRDTELNGSIQADAILYIPRLSATNTDALTLIQPLRLLCLGVSQTLALPDFVRGTIAPSLAQQYSDLLERTKAENEASTRLDDLEYDNFSSIGYL